MARPRRQDCAAPVRRQHRAGRAGVPRLQVGQPGAGPGQCVGECIGQHPVPVPGNGHQYGGWRIICWTLILAVPVGPPVTVAAVIADPPRHVTAGAAAGLAYVCFVSLCLGFFAWYQRLAAAGWPASGACSWPSPR